MIEIGGWALGTFFQGAQLAVITVALIALLPKWWQRGLDWNKIEFDRRDRLEAAKSAEITRYAAECTALRGEVKVLNDTVNDCEEECRSKLREMDEKLWGMRKQNIAEQISLISVIMRATSDNPELKSMLGVLEAVRGRLDTEALATQAVEGAKKDEEGAYNAHT